MNTKLLMSASAVVMGVTGLALTFLPHELLDYFSVTANIPLIVGIQLLGALYLAMALLNWMAKGNLIGGIYSRPVAIANFMHFMMGALLFFKQALKSPVSPSLLIPVFCYISFALLFGMVTFRHPGTKESC